VLHVEGMIKGTVTTEAVNIGITGAVEGKIQCTSLQIKGAFVGEARCQELIIANKARVRGTITYETLSIQRGAYVEGELARAT
jgi:cytoskeletal protein CcmA (bactofilin family)